MVDNRLTFISIKYRYVKILLNAELIAFSWRIQLRCIQAKYFTN